jgi:hypothetical protein
VLSCGETENRNALNGLGRAYKGPGWSMTPDERGTDRASKRAIGKRWQDKGGKKERASQFL